MRAFALYNLIACAALFGGGFLVAKARRPPASAVVRDTRAMAGLLLQTAGFAIALLFRRPPSGPVFALAASIVLALVSVCCAWWSFAHLGKHLRLSAELVDDHQLIVTGPYRIVRHPIYFALAAIYAAAGLLLSEWPAFLAGLALVIAGTEIRVRIEDRLLESRFGARFHDYRRRTPAYIPYALARGIRS